MKQYLQLLPVILFPYFVLFVLVSILHLDILEALYHGDSGVPLLILFAIYIVAPLWAVVVFAKNLAQKRAAKELLRVSKIIKLIHVPAYILLSWVWLALAITVPPLLVVTAFLSWVPIFSSGLLGLGGIIRGVKENRVSKKTAVPHGFFQFVFGADILSAIILCRKMK